MAASSVIVVSLVIVDVPISGRLSLAWPPGPLARPIVLFQRFVWQALEVGSKELAELIRNGCNTGSNPVRATKTR